MALVLAKTSNAVAQEAASSVKETSYEPNSYEAGLVALGRILLKNDGMTDWMSVRKISGQCLKHWKDLPRKDYSIRCFSDWVSSYFSRCGEIQVKDLRIRYKTELSSTRRDSDKFLQFVRV